MPPEWARHTCCWMAWPCREDGFYDIEAARDVSALVAREIARREPVCMIANPEDIGRRASAAANGRRPRSDRR